MYVSHIRIAIARKFGRPVQMLGLGLQFALLSICMSASADALSQDSMALNGFGDIRFGQPWQGIDWVLPADWRSEACPCERVFYNADSRARHALAGVELDWPGLSYHFFDDRFYAAEGEFASGEQSFIKLRTYLEDRYGKPSLTQSWQGMPRETYVHKARLQSAAWYSRDGKRSIWLMSDRKRGSLIALDNTNAQAREQAIDDTLAVDLSTEVDTKALALSR